MTQFEDVIKKFNKDRQTKEEYLKRLEETYDNQTWRDVIELIEQVKSITLQDEMIANILSYVEEHNRITFKQWKVLRVFLKNNNTDKKYKYGK